MKTVLSLCDYSGNAVKPWANAGYECICVDLDHEGYFQKDGIIFVGEDVREFELPERDYAFVFAFPPCTDLAVSGARWFKHKGLRALAEAIEVFGACVDLCEQSGAPYIIENPVSTISTYYREPDYSFDPCEYAGYLEDPEKEAYTKKTCLWSDWRFQMPDKKPVFASKGSMMHRLPPSEDRARIRSMTPCGFAEAVFQANEGI